MKMKLSIKKQLSKLPDIPGVYIFKSYNGSILYVGKANCLRKRVNSYFSRSISSVKRKNLGKEIDIIDYIVTSNEAEALMVENKLIKQEKPKYNVMYRDDKSYPVVEITNEEFPRVHITRNKNKQSLILGPFTSAKLLKEGLSYIRKTIPYRVCRRLPKKACLDYRLGLCPAPCEGKISPTEYSKLIDKVKLFLQGEKSKLIKELEKEMLFLSKEEKYEEAANIRDKMKALNRISKETDLTDIHAVLYNLKQRLKLSNLPNYVEAFDIANISGKKAVGSMVAFRKGKPFKKEYRRFKIKRKYGFSGELRDDYVMMKEVLHRRYTRVLEEKKDLPDLIIIDGGKGHLNVAIKELENLNIKSVDIVSIAKKFDDIFHKDKNKFYKHRFEGECLNFFKSIRDEAHRFANTYYRTMINKSIKHSELDNIPGVGPKRKKQLLKYFGSVEKIKKADKDDLLKINNITENIADKIKDFFK